MQAKKKTHTHTFITYIYVQPHAYVCLQTASIMPKFLAPLLSVTWQQETVPTGNGSAAADFTVACKAAMYVCMYVCVCVCMYP